MLHLVKLAVGVRDVAQLEASQQARGQADPPLRHRTRNMPKRAAEIAAGGSIYWVIAGALLVRQRITAITPDRWEDGSVCAALRLHPELIRLRPRAMKPFQGWRYLASGEAPPDLAAPGGSGIETLPEPLRAALLRLALL